MDCSLCGNTGWMRVEGQVTGDPARVTRCVCRTRAKAAEAAKHPGGFRSIGELLERAPAVKAVINATDKRVAEIIEKCQGAAAAVTSGEIAGALWPGTSMDPKQAENLRRAVTESVARLRSLARMPIAASKLKPYGYFIPVDAREWREMYDRINNEAVKLHDWATLFNRNADAVRAVEGQAGFNTESTESTEAVSVTSVVKAF